MNIAQKQATLQKRLLQFTKSQVFTQVLTSRYHMFLIAPQLLTELSFTGSF